MRVVHVLRELNHSGAERMLECSFEQWREAGVNPVVVGMADGPHAFKPVLERAGYEVRLLPEVRTVRGLAALRRTLEDLRPEVVHIHGESCFDLVGLVAARARGVQRVVRTVHSNFCFSGALRVRRRVRVHLARRHIGVVWVACSEEVATTELTYSSMSPHVVENWIDVSRIGREATRERGAETRARLGISAEAKVVALVGNCGYPKNHEFLPRALAGCGVPVQLLHVGNRRRQPSVEAEAWRELEARHTAHHLGERDDVPALLAASDLFLLPSLREGFPLAAIEALCVGVPVLASDVVGLRWLAEVGSAKLIPVDDARAWGSALEAGLSESGAWQERARASAAEARERFTPERGTAQYVDVYRASA